MEVKSGTGCGSVCRWSQCASSTVGGRWRRGMSATTARTRTAATATETAANCRTVSIATMLSCSQYVRPLHAHRWHRSLAYRTRTVQSRTEQTRPSQRTVVRCSVPCSIPPSISQYCPVIYSASSELRNATENPMSIGVPKRPSGTTAPERSTCASVKPFASRSPALAIQPTQNAPFFSNFSCVYPKPALAN